MENLIYIEISRYIDTIVFPVVFAVQSSVFIARRFKIDFFAIITLIIYLIA
jgi:hypothetical protein